MNDPIYIKLRNKETYIAMYQDGRFIQITLSNNIYERVNSFTYGIHFSSKDFNYTKQFIKSTLDRHEEITIDEFQKKVNRIENGINEFIKDWFSTSQKKIYEDKLEKEIASDNEAFQSINEENEMPF